MLDNPLAGRALRAPQRSQMLVATEDGVFLWPGTALVYRRGNGFFAIEPRDVNSALGCLFGPAALDLPLQNVLERARDDLRNGHVAAVQQALDRLSVPPVSPNGTRLIRAIAARQSLTAPDLPAATSQDGTRWTECDVSFFARLYDSVSPEAQRLEKIFNPGSVWDPTKHPREPAGQSVGGEFAPASGDDGSQSPLLPAGGVIRPPWSSRPKPPLGDPPKIPDKEPTTDKDKYQAIREIGYWLAEPALAVSDAPVAIAAAALMEAARAAKWLAPYVTSYFDAPKTREELQAAASNPKTGYNVHHIAEQSAAEDAGFPRSQIDDPSNAAVDHKALVPEIKHWQITTWFGTPNPDYGGLSLRQYLKDKDWDTRIKVGLDGMRKAGVLK
jgi:hypothetical protein